MPKTLTGIALLVIILGCILVNNYFLNSVIEELNALVGEAQELSDKGEMEASAAKLGEAISYWTSKEAYFQSFMRHDETDSTIYSIQEAVYHLRMGLPGNFDTIFEKLKEMFEMEQVSINSIF